MNPTLGLIAPPANYPVPEDAVVLYSSRIRFSVFGLGLQTMTPDGYESVIDKIIPAAKKLTEDGASAIVLMGTSLTFYKGAAFNQKLIDEIRNATGLNATTMSTAVVDGLRAVGAKRIAVATAYNAEVNARLKSFLEESGFDVLALQGLGLEKIGAAGKITQEALQDFCAKTFESAPGADALLVSCGGFRTLGLLAPLESHTKAPVISSTPHALWAGVRLLGIDIPAAGYGRLLALGTGVPSSAV